MTTHHWWMLVSLTIQSDIPQLHRNSLAYLLLFFVVIKIFTFSFNLDLLSIIVEYILLYSKKWGLCYVRESFKCNLVCIKTFLRNLEPLLVKTQTWKFIFLNFFSREWDQIHVHVGMSSTLSYIRSPIIYFFQHLSHRTVPQFFTF
jgi:hypothetical protein